jgi:hypothetical protein
VSVVGDQVAEHEKIVETGTASGNGHKRLATPTTAVDVVDDLPAVIPLALAEIDVIESYLGKAIDALLGPIASTPSKPEEA